MNPEHQNGDAETESPFLLKYYIQKVFSKIKLPKEVKPKTAPTRKNRDSGE